MAFRHGIRPFLLYYPIFLYPAKVGIPENVRLNDAVCWAQGWFAEPGFHGYVTRPNGHQSRLLPLRCTGLLNNVHLGRLPGCSGVGIEIGRCRTFKASAIQPSTFFHHADAIPLVYLRARWAVSQGTPMLLLRSTYFDLRSAYHRP